MEDKAAVSSKLTLALLLTLLLIILLVIPGLAKPPDTTSIEITDLPDQAITPSPPYHPLVETSPQPTTVFYLPLLSKEHLVPTPTQTPPPTPANQDITLFCDDLGIPLEIPDDDPNGINDQIAIYDNRLVSSINLYVNISHSWIGDLRLTLTNETSGETITALDRPGIPGSSLGCGVGNIITILDDQAIQPAEEQCASFAPAISGIYQPAQPLSAFTGLNVTGTWRINISDNYPNDTGRLKHWCLAVNLVETLPAPTPPPTPISLPDSAYVSGITGQDQLYPLDCESRSAVDWAKHFGKSINEENFLNHLPRSDDPEAGFVGEPDGQWGSIPPDDYGVHAPPVAQLLQGDGLVAYAHRSLQWDELRAEVAAGNPVIVWIIGGVSKNLVNGIPYYYTAASTGKTTIVAPGEHTVIVVGYDPENVTVLNGGTFVDVPIDQFLDSWSVLQFRAVLTMPDLLK